jgi:hypothetical protein
MDRLGSGGASRSRSDGAKRYALELARFKIVARFAIPVLVGATWSRLLGRIDNQRVLAAEMLFMDFESNGSCCWYF